MGAVIKKKRSVRARSTPTNILAQAVCEKRARAGDSDTSNAMSREHTASQPDNSKKNNGGDVKRV
jgi:hypothetical protein